MLNKWLVKIFVAVALLVAVGGGSGIVADGLGFEATSAAQACGSTAGGGGC